jgi:hypothetical protein
MARITISSAIVKCADNIRKLGNEGFIDSQARFIKLLVKRYPDTSIELDQSELDLIYMREILKMEM